MALILAFESSTKLGSVAVIQDGKCLAYKESDIQKSHSENLHQFAVDLISDLNLKFQDFDYFASGIGPGSFTGIRVSVNAVKSFAYAFSKPVIGIDSLLSLAFQNSTHQLPTLCLINAYKNMAYYGIYQHQGLEIETLKAPSVILMKEIESQLTGPLLTVGDGFLAYQNFLPERILKKMQRPSNIFDFPTAKSVGLLAEKSIKNNLTLDWKSLNPLYIRSSEAEETSQGIVWSPLDFKE